MNLDVRGRLDRGFWPSEQETLLLRAAVLDGDEASRAWKEVQPGLDLEHLSREGARLLPLLYRNLRRLGTEDPLLPALKMRYRHTWARNQIVIRRVGEVVGAFREAGIETLVLKGPALIARHYGDPGLRPLGDLDVLVHPDQVAAAVAELERRGWQWNEERSVTAAEAITVLKAVPLVGPDGIACDLHRYTAEPLLFPDGRPDPDADFWDGAVRVEIGGATTLVMGDADQLLHVCVHGARANSDANVRWAADSAVLMRAAGAALDWERLVAQAVARSCASTVRAGLRFLVEQLWLPVPDDVLAALEGAPGSRGAELFYRALERSSTLWSYAYLSRPWSPAQRIARFPGFLRIRWAVDHPRRRQ